MFGHDKVPHLPSSEHNESRYMRTSPKASRTVLQGLGIDTREGHHGLPIARMKERKRGGERRRGRGGGGGVAAVTFEFAESQGHKRLRFDLQAMMNMPCTLYS